MKNPLELPLLNPRAAGVDVGSEKFFASVGGGEVQVFLTVTAQMQQLCAWFREQGVTTVAMEATGVYWINLYTALEAAGLEVLVVNGAHCRNIPGRKSDMKDCQWLAVLHAHGLLRSGFIPPSAIRELRDYLRLREDLVGLAAQHVQHMQKALDRLNVKLHVVISSLTGASGLRILEAILGGERDPEVLVRLCDTQILKTKRAAVVESLRGLWRPEHLFALQAAWEGYHFYQGQIARCDERLAQSVRALEGERTLPPLGPRKELRHNALEIDGLQRSMARIYGRDLTRLPCLNESTVAMFLGEVGADLGRWQDWRQFGSWLGLAPSHSQSGHRRRREKRPLGKAGRILCRAVQCMAVGKHTWLAAFYRRIRARRGAQVAIKATAYKLARLIYLCLTRGWEYVEQGISSYAQRLKDQELKNLLKRAKKLNLTLVPTARTTS